MKIAVNSEYGGFSLSKEVGLRLREKGLTIAINKGDKYPDGSIRTNNDNWIRLSNREFGIESDNYDAWRADKRLIETIEEIGIEKSNGHIAKIRIVEIPDDIE